MHGSFFLRQHGSCFAYVKQTISLRFVNFLYTNIWMDVIIINYPIIRPCVQYWFYILVSNWRNTNVSH